MNQLRLFAPLRRSSSGRLFFSTIEFRVPPHISNKVCKPSDAVSLISANDTICVSGFVGQGSPDLILKALADRYERECMEGKQDGGVRDLTVLFGGGPGDWDYRGLNYLARIPTRPKTSDEQLEASQQSQVIAKPMIKRAIGGHYGQVPLLRNLVTTNQIEGWTLPMGCISRMIRAQATHSPGHITTVGLGTYVDPTPNVGNGGAANQRALESSLHNELVTKISIGFGPQGDEMKSDYLMYKAIPIQVAIIRATTADTSGNLSFEHESLLCDQRIIAAAAVNSGGVVLAQVKRICATGSLPSRSVGVPGSMVDCICVVDEKDHDVYHSQSYTSRYDPVLCGEIKSPVEDVPKMPLNERKIIARRASFALKPGKTINLGIGLPEGIANVAAEEGQLQYVTLTTEPGVFGGLPASGHDFGPSFNADALVEMNEMFDFYDGGGLDMCFLGAAEISPSGDVNVSRMSKDKLIGPGGFLNISQSTRNISFLCTFTAKGLDIDFDGDEGKITIVKEGKIKKFVNKVYERTFSGEEAVRRGQKVYYVTERAVFRRTSTHGVIELVEIAPGVDLQKDVLDQMEFEPIISPGLKEMDRRIFRHEKMKIELFGSLKDRVTYDADAHVIYIDLTGMYLASVDEVNWFRNSLEAILEPITKDRGPVDVFVNYGGFDCKSGLEEAYANALKEVGSRYYKTVKRYSFKAFRRAKLKNMARVESWDYASLFAKWDKNNDGIISPLELREGFWETFGIKIKQAEMESLTKDVIRPDNFANIIFELTTGKYE